MWRRNLATSLHSTSETTGEPSCRSIDKHCMLRLSHFQQVAQTHQGLQFLTDDERKTAKNVDLASAATSPLLAVNMAAVSLSFSNLECQNHFFL